MNYLNHDLSLRIQKKFHPRVPQTEKFWYRSGSQTFVAIPEKVDYSFAVELAPAFTPNEILMPGGILSQIAFEKGVEFGMLADTFLEFWHSYNWSVAEEYLSDLL